MKKLYKNPKFITFIFILIGILIVLSKREWRLEHPVVSFMIVWFSIPIYLFFLIKSKFTKDSVKEQPITIYEEPIEEGQYEIDNKVTHIEKRTVTKDTTTTTKTESEIIYFKEL